MKLSEDNKFTQKQFFKEWLEKLQQESWQLELLISGFALYGIYEARPLLHDVSVYIDLNRYGQFSGLFNMSKTVLNFGWVIFFINLLVHVVLRGLWIGAIGLRYISAEIEYDELNYSEVFTNHLKKRVGSYDDFIERLERICSVLFAFTFLLFLLFLSGIIFFAIFGLTMNWAFMAEEPKKIVVAAAIIYLVLGFLVFIDFISLGGMKRIENHYVSKGYLYIYRFYSTITLSFLYRPILYNFIDHKYTRKILLLSIPYFLVLMTFDNLISNDNYPHFPDTMEAVSEGLMINDYYYDDLRNQLYESKTENDKETFTHNLPRVSFSHFHVRDDYCSFFMRMLQSDQDYLIDEAKIDPYRKRGLRIGLFGSNKFEDEFDGDEKVKRDSIIIPLKEKRLQLKEQWYFENQKDTVLEQKIDSLTALIQAESDKWYSIRDSLADFKMSNIKDFLTEQIRFKVDSTNYVDSLSCFYYEHPNYGEKGILCHFPTKNITQGPHSFSFERDYWSKRSKQTYDYKVVLPFIKYNSN